MAAAIRRSFSSLSNAAAAAMKYSTPLVIEPRGDHKATIILSHGLGDSGHGWIDFARIISNEIPEAKWILPHAPDRPVSINGGMSMPAWYDITQLGPGPEDEAGYIESKRYIEQLARAHAPNGDLKRTVLAGFSQGGALSTYIALTSEIEYGALVVLSAYMPLSSRITEPSPANKNIPLLMGHGTSDNVIPFSRAKQSFDRLQEIGMKNSTFKVYPGMGHSMCNTEMLDVRDFLLEHIRSK